MNENVLILFNKISANPKDDELDVLEQVKIVREALSELKYNVAEYQVDFNLDKAIRDIRKANPFFIFNLSESLNNFGEFAYIPPAILSHLNIPYTGNHFIQIFFSANKVLAKKELKRLGIPTPAWAELNQTEKIRKNKKYILKPIWEEGSLGLDEDSVFKGSDSDFIDSLKTRNRNYYFVEEFIEGREFNVSILGTPAGPKVLPIAEMTFQKYPEGKPKIMGYTAKWKEDSFEYSHTKRTFNLARKDVAIKTEIIRICEKCWNEFGFRGYVRLDFRMDSKNHLYVIDINLNPCISLSGGFIAASEKAGYKFVEVIRYIVEDAFRN